MSEVFVTPRSSHIDSVEYAPGRLVINFKDGEAYAYEGVPPETFEDLKRAGSIGAAFQRLVKDQYEYEKL